MRGELELRKNIELTLTHPSVPLWFPNLSKDLAQVGWNTMLQRFQITPANYGTNRVLYSSPHTSRCIITELSKDANLKGSDIILVEELRGKTLDSYIKQNVQFYSPSEILDSPVMEILSEAFKIVSLVPSLQTTVFDLVKVIHLIKLDEAGEYDISFSEPHLPFSIFVSVPPKRVFADFLRVAEAIIHEAMHLQLTLIERIVPLVIESNNLYFSPWKAEFRKAGGILHALYVFQVINSFYRQLAYCLPSEKYKNYLVNRQNLISQQVVTVNKIDLFSDLTKSGKEFVSRLIAKHI